MIETLRIENVAILTRGELEFGPGLNVLTGETGAGKSIVLGSLALLAGARFSTDVIREGSDAARVEAVFLTQDVPDLERELIEYCRSQLSKIKCPRSIDFDQELPRHPTGKLYKRLIKDRYWGERTSRIV